MAQSRKKKTMKDLDEARRIFEELGSDAMAGKAEKKSEAIEKELPGSEIGTLYEISKTLTSILEIGPLLERILDLAIQEVSAERGLIILFDTQKGEPEVVAARNVEKETETDAIQYSLSIVKEAGKGASVIATDATADDRYRNKQSILLYNIRSLMCVPMILRENVMGTVYLDNRSFTSSFDDSDLRFLESFANQAALAVDNARLYERLKEENILLREAVQETFGFEQIIGRSAPMEKVFKVLYKVIDSPSSVMLLGESGTGKELIAKAIHYNGIRKDKNFVAINCAALPSELLESELFGHVRGAFSGAASDKKGLMETADGGTIFFDEISELDFNLQAKLLRAVEESSIRRVGDTRPRTIDVRIICASNKNLKDEVEKEKFRKDLYYRLNVITIHLPTLRERPDDIPVLSEYFLDKMNRKLVKDLKGFEAEVLERFSAYHWPGNVRELENIIERAVVLADGPKISLDDLPEDIPLLSDGAGTKDANHAQAVTLFKAMADGGQKFWDVIRKPFLDREISRNLVKEVVMLGLMRTEGSYKKLAELFNVGDQYKKFHGFLKNNDCHVKRDELPSPGNDLPSRGKEF
ncbi:sigma 54-interacting transcriptional regulator [Acidobacteriota bacterium]